MKLPLPLQWQSHQCPIYIIRDPDRPVSEFDFFHVFLAVLEMVVDRDRTAREDVDAQVGSIDAGQCHVMRVDVDEMDAVLFGGAIAEIVAVAQCIDIGVRPARSV